MHIRHTQIALANATAGMTLSDPVLDTKGNILLPEGVMLTDGKLQSLKRHQIDSIAVALEALPQVDADAERDAQIARVERLFRTAGAGTEIGPAAVPMSSATDLLHEYILNFRLGVTP